MTLEIRTWEQGECVVSYRTNDRRDSRALFFIHGIGADSRFFNKQMKYFEEDYRVVAIDLPGHGLSRWDRIPALEDYSRAVTGIIQSEGISSVVLLGHSMGGCICLDLYSRRNIAIEAMILVSTASRLSVVGDLIETSKNDFMSFYRDLLRQVFSKKGGLMSRLADKCENSLDREVFRNNLSIFRDLDYTGILETVDVPVLVVGNKNDTLVPLESSLLLAERIKDASFVEFDSEGHIPFFENPVEFNEIMEKFLLDTSKIKTISPELSEILDK